MATPITALHTIPGRRTLTPLGRRIRARVELLTGGYRHGELIGAVSADIVWGYEREMDLPGTPWFTTHRPSGHREAFATLTDARAWTALPNVTDLMREQALLALPNSTGFVRARLIRALAIYDGQLIPGGYTMHHAPLSRCACGGILAETGLETKHWDVCDSCIDDPTGCSLERRYTRHIACSRPAPAQCGHGPCKAASQGVDLCESDLLCCRGGHHGDAA